MNRAVAFIDVLGFKERIMNTSAKDLGEQYNLVIRSIQRKFTEGYDFPDEPSLFPGMPTDEEYCNCHVFSDSIILTSDDDSEVGCLKVLYFSFHIIRSMMLQGFMVRGGVSFGEMYVNVDASVYVGKALTEAYQLETQQEWSGITIHDNLINAFPSLFDGSHKFGDYLFALFVKYPVPMKAGEIKDQYVINWRWNMIIPKGTKSLFVIPSEWSAYRKIINTLEFAKKVRETIGVYPGDRTDCPIEMRMVCLLDAYPDTPGPPSHGDEY